MNVFGNTFATEPVSKEPVRTWRVTFYEAEAATIAAHEHEVTTEGDVIFTTYPPEGGDVVTCSVARGSWVSVLLEPNGQS